MGCVSCPYLLSFCGLCWNRFFSGPGLLSFQILGYGRTHPAYRTPGNEDRLAFHLTRLVRVGDPQLANLPECHQLPGFGVRPAEYYVLPDPGLWYPLFGHARLLSGPIRRAGGFGHPPRPSFERVLDSSGASLAAVPALLFGVLRRHLLWCRGALRTGHRPAWLGRF